MNQSIDSLDQFRGTKICGVGLNLRYVQGLGAAGVPAGLGDYYNNISTGLTEGTLFCEAFNSLITKSSNF